MSWQVDLDAPSHQSGLSVHVRSAGSVVGIWGPNGAGKTTLLKAIMGLVPAVGTVQVGDVAIQRSQGQPAVADRRLGVVFQDLRLFPHLTVRENVAFGAAKGAVPEVAERLELSELLDRRPLALSGGERQRVALARALACRPAALLLDEPFSAVDRGRRRVLLPWLSQILRSGEVPALVVSHDLGELRVLADEVWVMDRGEVVAHGPSEAALGEPSVLRMAGRLGLSNVLKVEFIRAAKDGLRGLIGGQVVVLPGGAPDAALQAGSAWIQVRPTDLILAKQDVGPTSARNVFEGTVEQVFDAPDQCVVRLDVGGAQVSAAVTRSAVQDLGLIPGASVRILIKTTALRW